MTAARPTPFDLVFDSFARDRFPEIRASLAESAREPTDRDAFLLDRFVVRLLRDLVPDEGVGEAVDQHVAMLHNAYLFWHRGLRSVQLSREQTEALLADGRATRDADLNWKATVYLQFPERMIWAEVNEGNPHEPLDGVFVTTNGCELYRVLGVFGMHADRAGFTVAEVIGSRPAPTRRTDGTPFFAPLLPGGARAGLYSIGGPTELIELGARAIGMLPRPAPAEGPPEGR